MLKFMHSSYLIVIYLFMFVVVNAKMINKSQ